MAGPNEFDVGPYKKIIKIMLDEVGLVEKDCYVKEGDYWELWKGSAKVYISFFSLTHDDGDVEWYMDISSPVMKIPDDNQALFYRRLLEENANRIAIKFSVREDTIWCEITREVIGLNFEEAYRNLIRIGDVADEVDDTLRAEFFPDE